MFVEAFSPNLTNGLNTMPLSSLLPMHRTEALMASITSRSMPSVVAIDYDEERRRHVITVPPFLPADPQNDDNARHPSPLHRIHIMPLLTDEETSELLRLARSHATENESWNRQDSTRHASYPTVDFAVEESIEISQYLGASGIRFEERIFDALGDAFDVDEEDMSFLDLFCASYEVKETKDDATNDLEEERSTMDRLNFHRDGSLLSFTILLSPTDEFEGGGTIFDALGDVAADDGSNSVLQPPGVIRPPRAGYATLHSGKLLHGGHVVSKGQRIVLVGFVDVHERNIKPGSLGNATKEWGRNDVRAFWNRRRLSLLEQRQDDETERTNAQPVWKLKNWRYLPKEGRSHFGKDSVVPPTVLENMDNRASPERIRRRRLMTEDGLLREMLLPREERGEKIEPDEEEGEWMEVDLDSMGGLTLGWDDGPAE